MMGPSFGAIPGLPYRELALVSLACAGSAYLACGVVRESIGKLFKPHQPRERDMHSVPIPRFGGLAIWISVLAGLGLATAMPALKSNFDYSSALPFTFGAMTVIAIVGFIDDAVGLSSLTKFISQICAGLVLVLGGISLDVVYFPGQVTTLDPFTAGLATVVITVSLINAANFIDGLDGLLAGIAVIAGVGLGILSLVQIDNSSGLVSFYPSAILSFLLVGACLGFLPHNFHPARIFMGDTGSMQIGVILSSLSIQLGGQTGPAVYAGRSDAGVILAPTLVIMAVVIVPTLDMVFAVSRRLRSRSGIFLADKLHIHHRIVAAGLSHRSAVLVIYTASVVVATPAVLLAIFPSWAAVLAVSTVVGFVCASTGLWFWTQRA